MCTNGSTVRKHLKMVKIWKRWCRLCAQEDPNNTHINILLKGEGVSPLSEVVNKCFSININHNDDWPQTICTRCYQLVTTIITFGQRASKVQAMFAELFSSLEDVDPGQLKFQYELHELGEVELDLKLFPKSPTAQQFESKPVVSPNISEQMVDFEELGYMDEKILNANNIKTEKVDKDSLDLDDEEWKDQLLSSVDDHSHEYNSLKSEAKSEELNTEPKKRKGGKLRLEKQYTCTECNKSFVRYTYYILHMKSGHGITLDPPSVISYVCEECGQSCKTFGALKEHKLTHTEERPFKCSRCEKGFKSQARLKIHEDIHNETNYICPTCGLKLNSRRTLRMHMLVHSDQKRHKCDYCGNQYKRSKALKNHLILHTGLKPYKCDFCDKTFASGANCRSHKKKAHPVELAAMEAAGAKSVATNIPKLKQLKAATNKAVVFQPSVSDPDFSEVQ